MLHEASAFTSPRSNAKTSGLNQVHGVPGWRARGDSHSRSCSASKVRYNTHYNSTQLAVSLRTHTRLRWKEVRHPWPVCSESHQQPSLCSRPQSSLSRSLPLSLRPLSPLSSHNGSRLKVITGVHDFPPGTNENIYLIAV